MDRREVKQRFSIRKYKMGAASVLLATVFAGGLATPSSVSADEVEGAGAESQEAPGQGQATSTPAEAPVTYGGEASLEQTPTPTPAVSETPAPTAVEAPKAAEIVTEVKEEKAVETAAISTPVEKVSEASAPETVESRSASNSAFRANSAFRNTTKKEIQIYGQSQFERVTTRDNQDTSATAGGLKGFMQVEGRTADRELVRWELTYTPTRVNGRAASAPVGIQIALANNLTIVPGSVKFNNQTLSGNGEDYSASGVKANINQPNSITFQTYVDRKSITYSHVTVRMATDLRPNVNTTVRASGTPVSEPNNRNIVWVTAKFDRKVYEDTVEELDGPKDTTTTEAIPFETVYQADDQMEANATQVVQEGKDGEKTVTTTYTKDDQGNTVANRTETVVTEAVNKIVKVGTKSKVETTVIPFKTVYENDPSMKVTDPEVVVTEGKDGLKTVTINYTLDTTTGQAVASAPVEVVEQAVDKVVKRGSNRESKTIPYSTEYRENKDLEAGQQQVVQEGVDGFESVNVGTVNGNGQAEFSPKSDASTEQRRVPQLIIVMVEDVPNITLSHVGVLTPLWNNLQDGDKLLWIKAKDLPETFNNARASFSVKGVDENIKFLEPAGPLSASEIPSKYGLTPEEISGAELRMEMDRYTGNENSLINNTSMKALVDSVASTIVSINTRSSAPERYRHAEAALRKAGVSYKLDDASGLLAVEPKTQTITTVVYKPLDIKIGDESGELAVTQATLTVDGQTSVLEVKDGKVAAQYTPTSDATISISYSYEGAPTADRTMKVAVTAEGQSVYNNDQAVSAQLGNSSKAPVTKIVEVGTKAKVEVTSIAFETVYEEDPNMKADDPEVVVTEGQNGQKTVTTTYTLNTQTGEVTANEPIEETVAAVNRVVRRGVGQETKIAFETVYVANEQLEAGQQVVATEGVEGVRQPDGTVSREPVNKVIQVGTKPKVEEKTLDYQVRYTGDEKRPLGWESVKNAGVKGLERTTTTYTLNTSTGEVTASEPTTELVRRVINRVYILGTMPKVEVSEIAFQTEYVEDPSMKADDPEVVVTEGQNGQKTVTTTYTLDETTGVVTPNTPTEELVAAVNRVIRRGSGQESTIPFTTIYVANETLEAGKQEISTAGVVGTRHPNGSVTLEPVNQVVQVGTKPSVVVSELAFETEYQDDASMKASDPEVVVVEGKNGQKTVTVTYTLNTEDGTVTANQPTEELVAAVNRVIRRGVGQDSKIPFETLYLASMELIAGEQQVVTPGVEGTRHPNGSVTQAPVTQVIQVGIKPLVEETVLNFETVYQDDATMKASDPEVVVVAGQTGLKTVTTTYSLNNQNGQVTANTPTEVLVPAVNRVIKRGVGQDTSLPFDTVYIATTALDAGVQQVLTPGVEGIRHPNGSITKEAVAQIVQVGVKPVVVIENLAFQTIYQDDASMKSSDPEILVQAGQAGQRVTTTNYVMDEKTGLVSPQAPVVQETAAVNRIIKRGVGQETEVPFTTVYLATNTLEAGQKVVVIAGQTGLRHPNGSITKEAIAELVQVGVKPLVVTENLPFQTIYQDDSTMKASDPEVLVQAGQAGQRVTTTNYVMDEKTGLVSPQSPVVQETAAVDRIIKRGVGQETEIPFTTVYLATTELVAGQQQVLVAGQTGLRHPNGSVSREMVPAMIQVGIKPVVVTEELSYQTRYQEDPSMLASDPEVVVQAGQTGQRVSTTNYSLDQATGQVTALTPIVVETAAVDQIIKRGTGQNTELPFETHYVADATLAAGEKDVRIQGQTGIRHPNGSITKEVVAQVVAVGTRPSQRTETVAFATRYLEAKEMAANSRRTLVEGQTGQKTFTITYVLNTVNGQVTAQPETEALTIQPVTEVIEVGTKSTMRTVDLEFSTVYKEDKEMTAGQQVVDQEGQKGLDTYTTTYVLNVETGQVTAQPEVVERTSNPVARVVRVGVKPLVVETELGFETVYQDDPMMLPTDKEVVLVEGQVGKETRTTNYVLDIQTGQVTAQEPVVERQEAVNRLVKRGVGQTSPIAFKVIYKGDVTLAAGQRVVDQEGQEGLRHPNGSVLKEAVDQIIRVGLKPVEKVKELPFEEEVIEDSNLPLGQICVEVEGQAGKRITRITYSLNPETGEVTAHESVETLAPVKRIVRKGTKVEEVCPPAEVEVSTPAPAPEAKVLPNTGTADSAALLVAGGLAGLAGLGLATKKREED